MELGGATRRRIRHLVAPRSSGSTTGLASLLWDGWSTTRHAALRVRHPFPADERGTGRGTVPQRFDEAFFLEHLTSSLLPFWERHALDDRHGGFITHLTREGARFGDAKRSAMQGRMAYAFSLAHDVTGDPGHVALAGHAVEFLRGHLWDPVFGGWYRSSYRDGVVQDARKFVVDQAFAALGLARHYQSSGDRTSRDLAVATLDVLESNAWDPSRRGYGRAYERDWTARDQRRTACDHLDLLILLLEVAEWSGDARWRQRADELADIVAVPMRDPRHGCLRERFTPDWSYVPAATRDRVDIGHHLKAAWLLLRLSMATGSSRWRLVGRELLDWSLAHGWDTRHGGFHHHVFRNGRLASPLKLWWTQCEGLLALHLFHHVEGDDRYRRGFEDLARFAFGSFVDVEHGEWYVACDADGTVLDDNKGGTWKAAYHTVQACVHLARTPVDAGPWSESSGASRRSMARKPLPH